MVRAENQAPANQLSSQLAVYVSVPSEDGETLPVTDDGWFDGEIEPATASDLPDQQNESDATPATAPQQPADPSFAALQSWSFAGERSTSAATPTRPFLVDLPPESQTFSLDPEPAYEGPAERPAEPHDFRISDSVKVKAQPTGGGLGGRVTLTFTFPTGY
ncbi:MAG TPA: hypothetical protein VGJ75_12335 [Dongiaceae bacterium]